MSRATNALPGASPQLAIILRYNKACKAAKAVGLVLWLFTDHFELRLERTGMDEAFCYTLREVEAHLACVKRLREQGVLK